MIEKICEICGEPCKRNGKRFCSIKCLSISNTGKNSPNWKGGKVTIECIVCGKKLKVYPCWATRKFCNQKCMGKYKSENLSGKNNPNWRGGKIGYWSSLVYKRDNYKCRLCGTDGIDENRLETHHIYPVKQFPELMYDIDNGITLCVKHHKRFEGIEYIGLFDIIKEYNDKNNSTE